MRLSTIPAVMLLAACQAPSAESGDTPTLTIAEIQGDGPASPVAGRSVTTTGLVSGDFQSDGKRDNDLGGFYLQSEFADDDPATSEGLFVYDGSRPAVDVAVGDRVVVTGRVEEFFGETQLQPDSVRIVGRGEVRPLSLELPVEQTVRNSNGDVIADLERFEGMRLRIDTPLHVSNLRDLERFGAIGLAAGDRPQQFTNFSAPDRDGYAAHKAALAQRSIVLDDGRRDEWPNRLRHLPATDRVLRAGDSVTGLNGNLRYSRGSGGNGDETWRLMPDGDADFAAGNPRPRLPAPAGDLRIASLNVLNFFAGIDDGRPRCGPSGLEGCRGADSRTEWQRQRDKIVSTLIALDADIVGLVELENDGGKALGELVDAINARLGEPAYAAIDAGIVGGDAIATGLLYRRAATRPIGDIALLDKRVDARFDDDRNRPALAQTFQSSDTNVRLTVAVNHFKSKGSACDEIGDPNRNDGQGNCSSTRSKAAAALADWLLSDPTDSGDADFLIIGDLNAYRREAPLAAFDERGLVDLLADAEPAYSFLFDSQIGALDHAIASPSLARQVMAAFEWHINADEAPLLDYNLENGRDPDWFDAASPYRSSDHDPVVIDLELRD